MDRFKFEKDELKGYRSGHVVTFPPYSANQ